MILNKKLILLGLGAVVVLVGGYIYKFQQLLNEGQVLLDERCQTIDPVINKKKDAQMRYFYATQSPETEYQLGEIFEEMYKLTEETITLSSPWLNKAQNFMARTDYQLILDKKLKEGIAALIGKYNADYQTNLILLDSFKNPSAEKEEQLKAFLNKQLEAQRVLDEAQEAARNRFDIRYLFVRTPQIECQTEEWIPEVPSYTGPEA